MNNYSAGFSLLANVYSRNESEYMREGIECVRANRFQALIECLQFDTYGLAVIKHGLWASRVGQGNIKLDVWERDDVVRIDVTDNGKGLRATAGQEALPSPAPGNIESRLKRLAAIHQQRIQLHTEELKDLEGHLKGVCSSLVIFAHPLGRN